MRSGDGPTGNGPATDPSAAPTEIVGKYEDIGPSQSAGEFQPAREAAGAAEASAAEASAAEPGAAEAGASERGAAEPGVSERGGAEAGAVRSGPEPDQGQAKPARRGRGPRRQLGSFASRAAVRAGLASAAGVGRLRPRADRRPAYAAAGGKGFARVTLLPTILVMAWLLVGLPLLLAGAFLPAPMLLIAVPLAVALAAGLRRVPASWPRALPREAREARSPRQEPVWPAWWGVAGTVAVAVGFAVWQYIFNSQTVIVLRDPGAYLQTGYWIAQHGSLPIPQSLAAFGGVRAGLGFSSIGFFAQGTSVVPGVMSGLPLLLTAGFWAHGTSGAAAMGPILGGLAVLAFGGLVGRLAGPQWAPAGALVLGFTLPEQYVSRGSFSETVAQVLLFGGLSLVADALTLDYLRKYPKPSEVPLGAAAPTVADPPRTWRHRRRRQYPPEWALMGLGGLALGLTALVRFDGLLDVIPAIAFIGVLVVRRSAAVLPFSVGLIVGVGYGLAGGYLLARPFVDSLRPMPELIGLIAAWFVALTLAGVELLRLPGFRHGLRALAARRPARWLPDAVAALAVAVLIAFAIRPYLQTVRGPTGVAVANYVASLQRLQNLPVDPGRLYAEDTLYWVIWYIGVPAVLLGGFGLALLIRRFLRALLSWQDRSGTARIWALPLAIICTGSAAVLWQPQTVPDQPWASRRLVPLVLPGLILCAIWASAWLRGRARSRGAGTTAASFVGACCVVALLVPTVVTTFGLGLTHTGKDGGLQVNAAGLALKRTGQGEVGAVDGLCSALGPAASVLIVDRQVAQQFTQVIRGMCGVPVAWMAGQPSGNVETVLGGIMSSGRRPVLLGSRPSELHAYGGGNPVRVLDLTTTQDPHTLTQPPTTPWPASYVIWMSAIAPPGARV